MDYNINKSNKFTWKLTAGCGGFRSSCQYCQGEIYFNKLKALGLEKYKSALGIKTHEDSIYIPYSLKKPRLVIVSAEKDLFDEATPWHFVKKVFAVMYYTQRHIYKLLTERADRFYELQNQLNWTPNILMGVSVDDETVLDRVDFLKMTEMAVSQVIRGIELKASTG